MAARKTCASPPSVYYRGRVPTPGRRISPFVDVFRRLKFPFPHRRRIADVRPLWPLISSMGRYSLLYRGFVELLNRNKGGVGQYNYGIGCLVAILFLVWPALRCPWVRIPTRRDWAGSFVVCSGNAVSPRRTRGGNAVDTRLTRDRPANLPIFRAKRPAACGLRARRVRGRAEWDFACFPAPFLRVGFVLVARWLRVGGVLTSG